MVAAGVFATGSISSYCTTQDVLALLSAYDVDGWGGEAVLSDRILQLLGPTRQAVDTEAGRDFFHHPDDGIALDGSGTRVLSLADTGVHPPAQVTAVSINGTSLPAAQWRYYPSAHSLKLIPTASVQSFTIGVQNVVISLDWGYETPPADIAMAQAKLVAAQLISELSAEAQAVQGLTIGDYTVRYSAEGRYGADVGRLLASARELIRRYRVMRVASV